MSYGIEYTKAAAKALGKMPREAVRRIRLAVDALAIDPFPTGVKALQGQKGAYRIRVGDYRVIYEVERGQAIVLVIKIGDRREVYR
jgi:mRNA interferase RelE/StbE